METNPYAPPQSDLNLRPESGHGPLMPFEDPVRYPSFVQRVTETLRWIFLDRDRAGEALGGNTLMGAPIGFYALLGLAPAILIAVLAILYPIQPFWQGWMGIPKPVAPMGAFQGIAILAILVTAPFSLAITIAITSLLYHLGLWIVKGTREGLGLLATFRSVLYLLGAISIILFPFQLLTHVPGILSPIMMGVGTLLHIGSLFYQGVILAKAHRTDVWRGILGVWTPILGIFGLVGICVGTLWLVGGHAVWQAILQGVQSRGH